MIKQRIYAYGMGSLEVLSKCGIGQFARFWTDYLSLRRDLSLNLAPIAGRHKIKAPGISFQKYLDVDYWLFEHMVRCYQLGLHNVGRKLHILDIGTGAAYFPFICRFYGHEVEAVDVDDNPMYNEIVKTLGIKRYEQFIHSYSDLVTTKRYDFITAFMICFNCHMQPDLWHVPEWEYFLGSLHANNLNPGGEVYLSFNAETPEEPVSKDLLAYFSANNALVDGGSKVHLKGDYRYPR